MKTIFKHFDWGSLAVIIITFILFALALFTKGFTHDLLLEAGVFLVSVKLILMAYKNSTSTQQVDSKLDAILAGLDRLEQRKDKT